MNLAHIRNFCIIAHIDHGKSTLADRMLEVTGTVEKRKMREQVLDRMDLERERGITIKMTPVRMVYRPFGNSKSETRNPNFQSDSAQYVLNLIDTPGHIDFSYEVSRAIRAVEGAILLVDATQGVQAQTLSVLEMAREANLTIIPVINKIDLGQADVEETRFQIMNVLSCEPSDILSVSAKTGEGVDALLSEIVRRVPPPNETYERTSSARALIFDFEFDVHRGVIVYVRMLDGILKRHDDVIFSSLGVDCEISDTGIFTPEKKIKDSITAGEIGYLVTGIKHPIKAVVGDTMTKKTSPLPPLPGYSAPLPVVFASLYPERDEEDKDGKKGDLFEELKSALSELALEDSSFACEEEVSGTLGRGYRVGFLGMLHLEILTERLKREFKLPLIIGTPTITYRVDDKYISNPLHFPDEGAYRNAEEQWVEVEIITPPEYLGQLSKLFHEHEVITKTVESFGHMRNKIILEIPLREMMRGFFDAFKSVTRGYGSLLYRSLGMRQADVARMDVIVGGEEIGAFSRIVSKARIDTECHAIVDRLEKLIPRQMFEFKIQAKALGRIVASRHVSALRKDVTGYLYGGDITRKRKLWEKQRKGKKKMKLFGKVNIPRDVFLRAMKAE